MGNSASAVILIVDDGAANRYALSRTLCNAGYAVLEAASREAALERVAQKPDLIILDVQLPDGNGFAICGELKTSPDTAHIPILMTSASFVESRDRTHGLESGADGYLTTPIDPLELAATVRALLRVRSAERALRDQEEQLRLMVESVRDYAIFSLDLEGRVSTWNTGAERVFGYTEGEILGQSSALLFTPEDREAGVPQREIATAAQTGWADDERWHLRKDGSRFFSSGVLTAAYNESNTLKGFVKIARDVTEKVQTEQKLRQSEERFALALQGMNDGLWDYYPMTGEVYYSPRYKQMLGYRDDEFPNDIALWTEALHPEDRERAWSEVKTYLANAQAKEYRNFFRLRHRDGSYRWVMSRAAAVRNANGAAIRMVGAHTDITDQKELESALREAYEKAESANNAKSEFLANMSHEIRTPMNAVIGLANILSGTAPLSDKQKQYLTTLQLSAEGLLALINDMLDFARIEGNMIELEETPFSLRELMERVISMMAVKTDEKGLQLTLDYRAGAEHYVGDPLRIQQVVVNLIGNAIKFTSAGSVAITVIGKPEQADLHKVSIRITDTGIGIPEAKLYSIFDKFTQGDASITRKYGGSGLGLTISKALIERMGGNIHVASVEGQGSVFTINLTLPVVQSQAGASALKAADEAPSPVTGARRVLLVEDYPANILVATSLLEEFGYAFDIAGNGYEALEKFAASHFDVVLMDVQMSGMDGFEATRRIRARERDSGALPIPIIAMTAHALIGDREKCLEAGMNDYISKPFNPTELKIKLARLTQDEAVAA